MRRWDGIGTRIPFLIHSLHPKVIGMVRAKLCTGNNVSSWWSATPCPYHQIAMDSKTLYWQISLPAFLHAPQWHIPFSNVRL